MVRHFIHLSSGESILVFTLAQVWSTKLVCFPTYQICLVCEKTQPVFIIILLKQTSNGVKFDPFR